MKKITYKAFIGLLFGVFGALTKLLITKNQTPIEDVFISESLWTNALIFFLIGYVLLGNLLWATAHKNN